MKPAACYLSSLLMLLGFYISPASAEISKFQTPLEQAQWHFSGNAFGCSLSQRIADFGKVRLVAAPGRPTKLELDADWLSNAGATKAWVIPASWNPPFVPKTETNMVWVGFKAYSTAKNVDGFLEGLEQGNSWQINVDAPQRYQAVANAINTSKPVMAFRMCRRNMVPKPFDYVRQRTLLFATSSAQLSPKDEAELYYVARYVIADKHIKKVLVDGYADVPNDSLVSLVLSKERSQNVASRLIELGVPPKLIRVFHHGNRSPVAPNTTKADRQLNRRVTIRLVKA